MRKKYTYKWLERFLHYSGFYKHRLERNDGKIVEVNKSRMRQLYKENRLKGYY